MVVAFPGFRFWGLGLGFRITGLVPGSTLTPKPLHPSMCSGPVPLREFSGRRSFSKALGAVVGLHARYQLLSKWTGGNMSKS